MKFLNWQRSFDPNKPIRLACDSSEYGIGAVLSHILSDGSDRPIGFISKSFIQGWTELHYGAEEST